MHSLQHYSRHTEIDPAALQALDERLTSWLSLSRRYRCTPEELPQRLADWKTQLADIDRASDLDGLQKEATAREAAFMKEAKRLSKLRQQGAARLSEAITSAMQGLGMAGGRFEARLLPLPGHRILLAVAAVALITFVMRRFKGGAQQARGPQLAGAGAPFGQQFNQPDSRDTFAQPMQRQAFDAAPAAVGAGAAGAAVGGNLSNVPAGFDADGFQRIAKMIFIRLQAANDAGNVDDLRKFTTPELFASLRLDLQERGNAANQTDVMQLDAELVAVPRQAMEGQLLRLGPLAGTLGGVDVAGADGVPLGINLLPAERRHRRPDPWRVWNWGLAAVAVVGLGLALWQVLHNRTQAADALEQRLERDAAPARRAAAQRQQLVSLIEGQAFLDNARRARPAAVEVIDELARRLPDGTYLEKLAIEEERLTLIGLSNEAPALIGRLQGSPLWRSPALTGALQPDPASGRDRFTLSADIGPKAPASKETARGNARTFR